VVAYEAVARAVDAVGMVARGGFEPRDTDGVPSLPDGRRVATVVVIGNVGGSMWPHFRSAASSGPNPLDDWTREVLVPIAESFGAEFVHPSDEPFQPFQRWAQRAEAVWPSPIGLLIHPDHGLWHAYRGAFLFPHPVAGLPVLEDRRSPCLDCSAQPCLSTCPVDAFSVAGYDSAVCADHVMTGSSPACSVLGCAARLACPVGEGRAYGPDQMRFHMRAFVGLRSDG
jgi:hypothetical protein